MRVGPRTLDEARGPGQCVHAVIDKPPAGEMGPSHAAGSPPTGNETSIRTGPGRSLRIGTEGCRARGQRQPQRSGVDDGGDDQRRLRASILVVRQEIRKAQ